MNIEFKYLIGSVIGGEVKNLCYIQKLRIKGDWGTIDTALTFDSFQEAMEWIKNCDYKQLGLDHGFSLVQVSSTFLNLVRSNKFNTETFAKLHNPAYMLR